MTDPFPFDAAHVVVFHDACLESGKWPDEEAPAHPPGALWPWIEENHGCNARLLREQDPARRTGDPEVAAGARAIERLDHQRRDAIDRIDELLAAALPGAEAARLVPETPGMMIDELSSLALRMKATAAAAGRESRPAGRDSLAELEARRVALAKRLQSLLDDCRCGRARFEIRRAPS